ncbi:MAG: hypothetical protein GY757_32760 [bacterium]|nr:hypothetical protein [bacterium]
MMPDSVFVKPTVRQAACGLTNLPDLPITIYCNRYKWYTYIMKKIIILIIVLFNCVYLPGETKYVEDTKMMKRIVGKWVISDRPYIYEYTTDFFQRINGFLYNRFKISPNSRENRIYTIWRSPKTGRSYFCRGKWYSRWDFRYSASRIVFKNDNKFIVYSKDNPNIVYFVAQRVTEDILKKRDAKLKAAKKKNAKKKTV